MKNIEIIFNGNRNIGIDVSDDLWRRLQDSSEEVEFIIQVTPTGREIKFDNGEEIPVAKTKIVTVTPVEELANKIENNLDE